MTDQLTNCITFHESGYEPGQEIIRIDKEGFHCRGQFIPDAGEAHRLMVEFLKQNTQPRPQGPTDEKWFADFAAWLAREMPAGTVVADPLWWAPRIARAVLARWARPAIEPVPIAERLPGPEDCDAEGCCWVASEDCPAWHRVSRHFDAWHYWLPHHALPVPQQEVDCG